MPIQLNHDKNFKRYYVVVACIALLIIPIFFRLYDLQVSRAPELRELAARQHNLMIDIKPERGQIFDRNMKPLATSLRVASIYAVPRLIRDKESLARTLSPILDLSEEYIMQRFAKDKAFVWLKRKVSHEVAEAVRALKNPYINSVFESKRFYPHAEGCANILGFCDIDEQGIDGLELQFNKYLAGQEGYRVTKRDAIGREIVALEEKVLPVVNGHSLILNIDHVIQYTAEKALQKVMQQWKPKGASCVVMDPNTGQILAMVSLPSFNPNDIGDSTGDARRNRAVADFYEPGSIFKIVTAAAALEENIVNESDTIFCENGEYRVTGSRILHDVHAYGNLTFEQVVEKSSNIGTVKIAQKLGADRLYYYIKKFGFGDITGIDFPGERLGIIRPVSQWSKYSISSIPIGQEVTATALQMVQAMSVIANGGFLVRPYIVSEVVDEQGMQIKAYRPLVMRRVISADTAARMRKILYETVESGTGKNARIEGIPAGGKTGTAQKILPNGGGYSHSNFIGSFIGFAPVEKPLLVVNVMVDDPHPMYYGGTVAAPVFREIVQESLFYLKYVNPDEKKVA